MNNTQTRIAAAALALLATALLAALPARAQSVQEVVASIEQHYTAATTITAKVVQKTLLKAIGRTQIFEGALGIKKPGRLRLDFTNGQMILVDGKSAIFYSRRSEQMIKKTFRDVRDMNIPVAFLLGAGRIRDDFDVLQPDPKQPTTLELLPKREGAAMKKLELLADPSGRITELTIIDRLGNRTDIVFSDIVEGQGIDDSLFKFTPPKGTEIIEQ